jgi:hypothetical protein
MQQGDRGSSGCIFSAGTTLSWCGALYCNRSLRTSWMLCLPFEKELHGGPRIWHVRRGLKLQTFTAMQPSHNPSLCSLCSCLTQQTPANFSVIPVRSMLSGVSADSYTDVCGSWSNTLSPHRFGMKHNVYICRSVTCSLCALRHYTTIAVVIRSRARMHSTQPTGHHLPTSATTAQRVATERAAAQY